MNKLPDTIYVREYRTSPTNTELKVVPIQVDEKTAKYIKLERVTEWAKGAQENIPEDVRKTEWMQGYTAAAKDLIDSLNCL